MVIQPLQKAYRSDLGANYIAESLCTKLDIYFGDFLITSSGISLLEASEIRSRLRKVGSRKCPNRLTSTEKEVL